jgi:hypothetical protein
VGSNAVPPEDLKSKPVTLLLRSAALNLAVRLKFGFFTILGVSMKRGLAARTGAATMDAARVTASIRLGVVSNRSCEVIYRI